MAQEIKRNTAEEFWVAKVDHQAGNREPNGLHAYFRKDPHPTNNPTIEIVDPRGKTCVIAVNGRSFEAEYYFTGAPPSTMVDSNNIFGGTIGAFVRWCLLYTAAGYLLHDPAARASLFSDMGIH